MYSLTNFNYSTYICTQWCIFCSHLIWSPIKGEGLWLTSNWKFELCITNELTVDTRWRFSQSKKLVLKFDYCYFYNNLRTSLSFSLITYKCFSWTKTALKILVISKTKKSTQLAELNPFCSLKLCISSKLTCQCLKSHIFH